MVSRNSRNSSHLPPGQPRQFWCQDFFEFVPQFKLIIAGNHKPGLRSVDEAIRRRFHLVPFNVTISIEERDKKLPQKLKAEWPGILQWAIDGCLRWQAEGLNQPEAVAKATAAYLEAEDAVGTWIDEKCILDPNGWETPTNLFRSWKFWAECAGEFIGSQKQFGEKLEVRGLPRGRKKLEKSKDVTRVHRGIRLNEQEQ